MSLNVSSGWKRIDGTEIRELSLWIWENAVPGTEVHIGTDSQQLPQWTKFVCVVVIRTPGAGAIVAYQEWRVPRIRHLRQRLLSEVMASTQVGLFVSTEGEYGLFLRDDVPLCIHIDANINEDFESAKYANELAGLVLGQGFSVLLKPEAWASSSVADRVVKSNK